MNISHVGAGKVSLIAGGGKVYTDIAARFTRSEKGLDEIIASPYDADLVDRIVTSGHTAATEFDYFIFGVEGYARVTEVQLVRKRLASYLIKSGRPDKKGKRSYDMVLPESIMDVKTEIKVDPTKITFDDERMDDFFERNFNTSHLPEVMVTFDTMDILTLLESWYEDGVATGHKEEELRYMKPQATEFKAIIGMNAHALIDWWKIRLCKNAQTEIRDLAMKMFKLCKEAAPDLFKYAGPSCVALGYCPENKMQNKDCNTITKDDFFRHKDEVQRLVDFEKEIGDTLKNNMGDVEKVKQAIIKSFGIPADMFTK